jgi:hypothetical protein
MKALLFLFLLLAGPGLAQTVTVQSGEHGRFTRISLNFPTLPQWTMGRTDSGYALETASIRFSYNLSDVYRRIGHQRLKTISANPETGALELGIDCLCYALPYEFSDRALVIDIYDGSPPAQSSFEQPLYVKSEPEPDPVKPESAAQRYDWIRDQPPKPATAVISLAETAQKPESPAVEPAPPDGLQQALDHARFREELVQEIARGATEGKVNLTLERKPSSPQSLDANGQVRVTVGELPGLDISTESGASAPLTETGNTCPDDEALNIRHWVEGADPAEALAAVQTGLVSEFDEPDRDQIDKAAKTYLYYGFGAEARNLLAAFQSRHPEDDALMAMSYLLDGDPSPTDPFIGMQSCDSVAALWATLAAGPDDRLIGLNGMAVARNFMGLPLHLKRIVAQGLAERLDRQGEAASASIIRKEMERAAPDGDPEVALMEADHALNQGHAQQAEAKLATIPPDSLTAETLLARVEARYQQGREVDAADVTALQAFAFENGNGPRAGAFHQALVHAAALSQDFATAFDTAGDDRALRNDTWAILAKSGGASQLLELAVPASSYEVAQMPNYIRNDIARKLLELGLPKIADAWRAQDQSDAELAAQINLANNDGRAALAQLINSPAKADPALLAQVYAQLGAYDRSAALLDQAGDTAEAQRQRLWVGEQPTADQPGAEIWAQVAAAADETAGTQAQPPLERTRSLLQNSTTTRESIGALLAAVAGPSG